MARTLNSAIRFAVLIITMSVLALAGPSTLHMGQVTVAAACPPPSGANTIVVENCLTGNPATEWDLPSGASSAAIQGFATDISVNRGGVVHFKVHVNPAGAYHLDIYRMGYYGGQGARKIATINVTSGLPQTACVTDPTSGLIDCGNWTESAAWTVPLTATSGIYFAKAIRDTAPTGASHIFFIVRDDASTSDVVMQTADTTWQAYNNYGGNSLYVGGPGTNPGRAYKVSYNRPFITRDSINARSFVFGAEYPMVRWLEANGYDVSYVTGLDADRMGSGEAGAPPASMLLNHRLFLSVGHDEYWSGTQRANVEAARAAGKHLAFFSGNEIYWKTRWENSIDGSSTPHRTLVSYKETWQSAKIDPTPAWTGTWRDPRFSPPADGGRPENALTGQIYTVDQGTTAITVPAADGLMRLWRNTSVATLAPGTSATLSAGTLGYEWDEDLDNSARPPGIVRLSTTTMNVALRIVDYGQNFAPGVGTHHLTIYRHGSGALVFGAGTVQWSWGLDGTHDGGVTTPDVRMQQATVNLFADMGVQAGSLQSGLTQTTGSTDTIPPSSAMTSPASGGAVSSDTPVTITGTASDLGGGVVGGVEVSTDNGATWHPANGRESWSYTWTPGPQGTATIKSRAADDSGNIETPSATVPVTIGPPAPPNCPCTIWSPSTTPATASFNDAAAIEVGMRFRASVNGFISAIRFYKGAQNTGTHLGHLWNNTGTLLGTATFSGESASGWQEAALPSPVAISAGTTYVVSYHTDVGRYASDPGYFTAKGQDSPPLHALKDLVDGRTGVFTYGASAFPSSTFQATNYWVDVVFITSIAADTTPPAISGVTAAAGANGSETIAWTTNEASSSRVDYGASAGSLTSNVSDSALVTSHSVTLTGLAPSTTYFYRVTSADAAANSATSPIATDPPASFTTPAAALGDTLAADFSAGTTGGSTYISETANGEVVLLPAVGAEFSGSALPAGWQGTVWSTAEGGSGTGTFAVANGAVVVDGSRIGTTSAFTSGRSVEFVATFSGQGFEHVGLAKDLALNAPIALFTTGAGGQLLARSLGGSDTSTPLGATFLGAPHRYRIDWSASTAVYFVDGNVVATQAFTVPGTMIPVASDFNTGGGGITIDWMRLTPYAASGTFISRVLDAGVTATWGAMSWTARTPAGTSVAMSVNASNSPTPATTCAGFTPISASGVAMSATSRFIQYCAQLSTTDAGQTPSVDDVTIAYSIGPHATSTSVSCTPSTIPVNGATTCTATVTDTAGAGGTTPTGSVTFSSDSGTFSGGGTCTLNASGQCSVTYTATVAGPHTVTAPYGGDSGHAASSGNTSVTATTRSTSASLSCTPATFPVNGTTTCTATVIDTSGAGATTPTGTVTVTTDSGTFTGGGTCTLNASGQCSVTYTATVIGPHTMTAAYGGDGGHAASSGNTSVTATTRSTSATVSCSPVTVPVNGATTCTATVTDTAGSGATTPTGTATFTTDSGTFSGGGACTLNASGQCSVTYTPGAIGPHTVTTSYAGDSTHATSSGNTSMTAIIRSTSTIMSCAPATVPVNGATTCTATVTDTAGVGATVPTGTVAFATDSGTFTGGGSCALDATGRCSVTYTPTVIGAHTIAATSAGDSVHAGSSGTSSMTAIIRSTSTSVSCTPATVPVNGNSTCTATVTDTAGAGASTLSGTVAFATDSGTFSGGGSCTLDATGRCTVTYSPTVIAPHTIAASYGGDTVHAASSGSNPVTAIIRSTSTSVSCSPNNVILTTTCTATVADTAGAGASTPTGTVSFSTDSGVFVSGASCTLDGTGRCSVTYTPTTLGPHTLTGSYGGDAKHGGSSGNTSVTAIIGH
jgi:hypothetical protein